MKKDTLLTHVGRNPAQSHGTINTPVFRTSTVVFKDRCYLPPSLRAEEW